MTLKEFKNLINALPAELDDAIMICQKDSEGNGYSPLYGVDENAVYKDETTWSGTVFFTKWSAYDAGMEEKEWEEFKKETPKCIVIRPIN